MAASCLLCVAGYAAAVFVPWPLLSLAGCALCGFSVGILWPGTFSLSMVHCPEGGTAMFALFALAGDVGCALGPGVVGAVSGMAGGALKAGLLAACAFPVLLLLAVSGCAAAEGGTVRWQEAKKLSSPYCAWYMTGRACCCKTG